MLEGYEAKIAALERMVGRQALEIEFLRLIRTFKGRHMRREKLDPPLVRALALLGETQEAELASAPALDLGEILRDMLEQRFAGHRRTST